MTHILITDVGTPRTNPLLGRRVAHDSRSLAYALPVGTPVSARHTRHVPVFRQSVGSCTCNAGLGALGTGMFYEIIRTSFPNLKFDDATVLALYKEVTKIDEFRGAYPPDDTGSSGNAVGKLFTQLKYIKGWLHALSFDAALTELSQRPVITGVPWYSSFDRPDSQGFITLGSNATLEGGHEIVVDEIRVEEQWVGCTNSWGTNYGRAGRFYMKFDLWRTLLSRRGDVTAFVPLTLPAPVPTPPQPEPPVVNVDEELNKALLKWQTAKGYR